MVVAVKRSRAEPILRGSGVRALVGNEGCETDDVVGEGLAVSGVGLPRRCVGILTGFDLPLADVGAARGELLRGGDVPASKAAACSERRLLVRISSFSFKSRVCRLAVDRGTKERGTIILSIDIERYFFLFGFPSRLAASRGSDSAYRRLSI